MEHPADTPVVERPASPIVSAPVATRLDAPLLAIMFYLLGDRGRWRVPAGHHVAPRLG